MADSLMILEEANGVAVLTLNRPEKRNALSRALRDEIMLRLDALEQSDAVRVVVLTGAPPAFCAGFDRTEFSGDGINAIPENWMEILKGRVEATRREDPRYAHLRERMKWDSRQR